MERVYDIFEKFPDGHLIWRASVHGQEAALAEMQRRVVKSPNGFQAMDLPTGEVIASLHAKTLAAEKTTTAILAP